MGRGLVVTILVGALDSALGEETYGRYGDTNECADVAVLGNHHLLTFGRQNKGGIFLIITFFEIEVKRHTSGA